MTYTTIAGDTFDLIAYKLYGEEERADELMEANPDLLDYFVFPAGIEVTAPDIVSDTTVPMPPWMED